MGVGGLEEEALLAAVTCTVGGCVLALLQGCVTLLQRGRERKSNLDMETALPGDRLATIFLPGVLALDMSLELSADEAPVAPPACDAV